METFAFAPTPSAPFASLAWIDHPSQLALFCDSFLRGPLCPHPLSFSLALFSIAPRSCLLGSSPGILDCLCVRLPRPSPSMAVHRRLLGQKLPAGRPSFRGGQADRQTGRQAGRQDQQSAPLGVAKRAPSVPALSPPPPPPFPYLTARSLHAHTHSTSPRAVCPHCCRGPPPACEVGKNKNDGGDA